MKVSGLRLAMLTGIGAVALMFLLQPYHLTEESELSAPGVSGGALAFKVAGRKLKEAVYGRRMDERADEGDMGTQDYGPIDPVPNSKTSIRVGPIDHGTPLIPYLPGPTGPSPPKPGS